MNQHHYLPAPGFTGYVCYPDWIGRYHNMPDHRADRPAGAIKHYNLHLVYSGRGFIHDNGAIHEMTAGTGFIYSPDSEQHYRSDPQDPWDIRWVHFDGEGIANLLHHIPLGGCWMFQFGEKETLFSLMDELLSTADAFRPEYESRLSILLYELLLTLVLNAKPRNGSASHSEKGRIMPAAHFIRSHCTQPLTLEEMAEAARYSPQHFSRTFHRTLGKTPVTYLLECRLLVAKQLLVSGTLSVKKIAELSGFQQSSYFIKKFRHSEGVTPQQFREMNSLQ